MKEEEDPPDATAERPAQRYDCLDRPLTHLKRPQVGRGCTMTAYGVCRKRTHLFPVAKQASTHVTYETTVTFLTFVPRIVVPIREVVVAAVVRHCDRSKASGRLSSRAQGGNAVLAKSKLAEIGAGSL